MTRCIRRKTHDFIAGVTLVFVMVGCACSPSKADVQADASMAVSDLSTEEFLDRIAGYKSAYTLYNLVPTRFMEMPGTRNSAWSQYEAEPFLIRDGARVQDIKATILTGGKLRSVQFSIDAEPCISTKALAKRLEAGLGSMDSFHPPEDMDMPPVYPPVSFRWRDEFNDLWLRSTAFENDCLDYIKVIVSNERERAVYRAIQGQKKRAGEETKARSGSMPPAPRP